MAKKSSMHLTNVKKDLDHYQKAIKSEESHIIESKNRDNGVCRLYIIISLEFTLLVVLLYFYLQ
jgi:hypothetical protein